MFDLGSIWDGVKKAGSTMYDGASTALSGNNIGDTLKGVGALAQAYGAYEQGNAANKMQQQMFAYQQQQDLEKKKRRNQAQDNIDDGFANLTFGSPKEEEYV